MTAAFVQSIAIVWKYASLFSHNFPLSFFSKKKGEARGFIDPAMLIIRWTNATVLSTNSILVPSYSTLRDHLLSLRITFFPSTTSTTIEGSGKKEGNGSNKKGAITRNWGKEREKQREGERGERKRDKARG